MINYVGPAMLAAPAWGARALVGRDFSVRAPFRGVTVAERDGFEKLKQLSRFPGEYRTQVKPACPTTVVTTPAVLSLRTSDRDGDKLWKWPQEMTTVRRATGNPMSCGCSKATSGLC